MNKNVSRETINKPWVVEEGYYEEETDAVRYQNARRFADWRDAEKYFKEQANKGKPVYMAAGEETDRPEWIESPAYRKEVEKIKKASLCLPSSPSAAIHRNRSNIKSVVSVCDPLLAEFLTDRPVADGKEIIAVSSPSAWDPEVRDMLLWLLRNNLINSIDAMEYAKAIEHPWNPLIKSQTEEHITDMYYQRGGKRQKGKGKKSSLSPSEPVYECPVCETRFTGRKWSNERRGKDLCPICRSTEPFKELRPENKGSLSPHAPTSGDMRFDCDARVEIWVTEDDLQDDDRFLDVVLSDKPDEEKVNEMRRVAVDIAGAKLDDIIQTGRGSVDITIDSLSADKIDIDRINWYKLIEDAEEDARIEEEYKTLKPFEEAKGGFQLGDTEEPLYECPVCGKRLKGNQWAWTGKKDDACPVCGHTGPFTELIETYVTGPKNPPKRHIGSVDHRYMFKHSLAARKRRLLALKDKRRGVRVEGKKMRMDRNVSREEIRHLNPNRKGPEPKRLTSPVKSDVMYVAFDRWMNDVTPEQALNMQKSRPDPTLTQQLGLKDK